MREIPPELIGKVIGRRLRELREDAELSQRALARLAGTDHGKVALVESGQHATTLVTVQRYARALDIEPGVVLVCLDPTWPTTAAALYAA